LNLRYIHWLVRMDELNLNVDPDELRCLQLGASSTEIEIDFNQLGRRKNVQYKNSVT
jgi:hypothetical protein